MTAASPLEQARAAERHRRGRLCNAAYGLRRQLASANRRYAAAAVVCAFGAGFALGHATALLLA